MVQTTLRLLLLVMLLTPAGTSASVTSATQPLPLYALPCNIHNNYNWKVVRNARRTTDKGLLDHINSAGRKAHPPSSGIQGTRNAVDFNNNTANIGARTYGICQDRTVLAARAGTVAKLIPSGGQIEINHGDGQRSIYAHLQSIEVHVGQWVTEGQRLGVMGNVGCPGCGIHLHVAVLDNAKRERGVWYELEHTLWRYRLPAVLFPGDTLYPGQRVYSQDYQYFLILQTDGNFVLYVNNPRRALWASNTAGRSVARAIMQSDGNLVLYDYSSRPVWNSGTNGFTNAILIVQRNGHAVIYACCTYTSTVWAAP